MLSRRKKIQDVKLIPLGNRIIMFKYIFELERASFGVSFSQLKNIYHKLLDSTYG